MSAFNVTTHETDTEWQLSVSQSEEQKHRDVFKCLNTRNRNTGTAFKVKTLGTQTQGQPPLSKHTEQKHRTAFAVKIHGTKILGQLLISQHMEQKHWHSFQCHNTRNRNKRTAHDTELDLYLQSLTIVTLLFSAEQARSDSSSSDSRYRNGANGKRSDWREIHKCKVVSAIVGLVVFVAVAIALAVYLVGKLVVKD